jgi:hypothetical protein
LLENQKGVNVARFSLAQSKGELKIIAGTDVQFSEKPRDQWPRDIRARLQARSGKSKVQRLLDGPQ